MPKAKKSKPKKAKPTEDPTVSPEATDEATGPSEDAPSGVIDIAALPVWQILQIFINFIMVFSKR